MTTNDLERYLIQNGFNTCIAPEVWMTLKENRYIDLSQQEASRLSVANDGLRMDIRIAADDAMRRREGLASSYGISVEDVPVRVKWA